MSWIGPPADDDETLEGLPSVLAESLRIRNGFITALGGFHLRGASLKPDWHALRAAWEGPKALYCLFPAVLSTDVPFGQDCFGDQYLLRNGEVIHLEGETGVVESMSIGWSEFMRRIETDQFAFLNLQALQRYREQGGALEPGQLLSVYPPFVAVNGGASFRPISALERISSLADFARQLGRTVQP